MPRMMNPNTARTSHEPMSFSVPQSALNLSVDYLFDSENRCDKRQYSSKYTSCDSRFCVQDIHVEKQMVPDGVGQSSFALSNKSDPCRTRFSPEGTVRPPIDDSLRNELGDDFLAITKWHLHEHSHPPRSIEGCRIGDLRHVVALLGSTTSIASQGEDGTDRMPTPPSHADYLTATPLRRRRWQLTQVDPSSCELADVPIAPSWATRLEWSDLPSDDDRAGEVLQEEWRSRHSASGDQREAETPGSYTKKRTAPAYTLSGPACVSNLPSPSMLDLPNPSDDDASQGDTDSSLSSDCPSTPSPTSDRAMTYSL
ncbi:hypothetical protein IAR55_000436 [Kwoniella newhampshirensis]|uniref:Uncharacterized protein n=1 Tax=Kwoniella newhampshirensis TaxID=1651941 RepID=A0AAW0Z6L3_9TREE